MGLDHARWVGCPHSVHPHKGHQTLSCDCPVLPSDGMEQCLQVAVTTSTAIRGQVRVRQAAVRVRVRVRGVRLGLEEVVVFDSKGENRDRAEGPNGKITVRRLRLGLQPAPQLH